MSLVLILCHCHATIIRVATYLAPLARFTNLIARVSSLQNLSPNAKGFSDVHGATNKQVFRIVFIRTTPFSFKLISASDQFVDEARLVIARVHSAGEDAQILATFDNI